MISDEYIKQVYLHCLNALTKRKYPKMQPTPDIFRGILGCNWKDQHPGSCTRHMQVFSKFNIVPKYCFSCYKVLIEPRTVVELFKLMIIFRQLVLENDNTRKCTVESREKVSGTYKGLIYCRSIKEGQDILKMLQRVVSDEISGKVSITLKRGCSEYPLAYPEYAQIGEGMTLMEYKEEWQEYEDMADKEFVANIQHSKDDTDNHPGYTLQEVQTMHGWLRYAAMIGDLSYMKISGKRMLPFNGMKRPPWTSR